MFGFWLNGMMIGWVIEVLVGHRMNDQLSVWMIGWVISSANVSAVIRCATGQSFGYLDASL